MYNHNPPLAPPASTSLLTDNHGRTINYLRMAIIDRCNLRCRYCMSEEGISFVAHEQILKYEEIERLIRIFTELGITKLRITGGEPFVRRGVLPFIAQITEIQGLDEVHITTNGVDVAPHIESLKSFGIKGINLSLDTLDRQRFWRITGRDYFEKTLQTLHRILNYQIPLKINAVVLDDTSDEEILRLADLTKTHPISVRFIEKMPFSGDKNCEKSSLQPLRIRLQNLFTGLQPITVPSPSTALLYRLPDYEGTIGIIEGNSRSFCSTCNKIRVTPLGILKTCLYDGGVLDLKMLLRSGAGAVEIKQAILDCLQKRYANGHKAEVSTRQPYQPSMAKIGG